MGKTRHGEPEPGDSLREFVQTQQQKHLAPTLRTALGRTDGSDRTKPDPQSSTENTGARRKRNEPSKKAAAVEVQPPEEKIVEIAQKVSKSSKRTAASVLAHIASLADRKDYFTALERALRENVDVLVPVVMSMPDWTKAIQNVHETNLEAAGGIQSEDPLGEIRKFLSGGEAA